MNEENNDSQPLQALYVAWVKSRQDAAVEESLESPNSSHQDEFVKIIEGERVEAINKLASTIESIADMGADGEASPYEVVQWIRENASTIGKMVVEIRPDSASNAE